MNKKFYFEVKESDSLILVDFLAEKSKISKVRLKVAAKNGAVWIKDDKTKKKRIRKCKSPIKVGDKISLFYDDNLIDHKAPDLDPIFQNKNLSVWFKPPGLVAQGSPYGDHLAMERIVGITTGLKTFLVHRLDREVSGLMVFAHKKGYVTELAKLWSTSQVIKEYQLEVIGNLAINEGDDWSEIVLELDGKSARTLYKVISHGDGKSQVIARLLTGRYHQIRQHFNMIGHPIIGDPTYGEGNKNTEGLRLAAFRLTLPVKKGKSHTFEIDKEDQLF